MHRTHRLTALAVAILGVTVAARADFSGPAPLAWRWAQRADAAPAGSPVVNGDTVYVAVGSRFYAIERQTGNTIWRYPPGEPMESNFRTGLVEAKDAVVAATDNRNVFAIKKAEGTLKWQYLSLDTIIGTPVFVGDAVVLQLAGSKLMALSADDGRPIWSEPYSLDRETLQAGMSAWEDSLIFFTDADKMYSFDVIARRPRWVRKFARLSSTVRATPFGDNLYLNSGSYLTAVSGATGRPRWERNLRDPLVFAPAVSTDGIVAVSREGRLYSFTLDGRPVFAKGVDLGSYPVTAPTYIDSIVVVPTTNGAVNQVDPKSGDVTWTFMMKPIVKPETSGTTGGGPGGMGLGGVGPGGMGGVSPGGGAGLAGGGLAGGGTRGGSRGGGQNTNRNTNQRSSQIPIDYVVAVGPAVAANGSLLVLTNDGSLMSFDKTLGVDLTPPKVDMVWPNPGDQTSGQPPLMMFFRLSDEASGIDPRSLKITLNGQEGEGVINRDNILIIRISSVGMNKPLPNGRASIKITLADWLGNSATTEYALLIDNTLRPPVLPGSEKTGTGPGGTQTGGSRGPGGGGGGRGTAG